MISYNDNYHTVIIRAPSWLLQAWTNCDIIYYFYLFIYYLFVSGNKAHKHHKYKQKKTDRNTDMQTDKHKKHREKHRNNEHVYTNASLEHLKVYY